MSNRDDKVKKLDRLVLLFVTLSIFFTIIFIGVSK